MYFCASQLYTTPRGWVVLRRQLTTPGNISAAGVYLHPIDIQHIVCTRQLDGKTAARARRRKTNRLASYPRNDLFTSRPREPAKASKPHALPPLVYISRLRQLPRCARNRPNIFGWGGGKTNKYIVKKYTRQERERERLS